MCKRLWLYLRTVGAPMCGYQWEIIPFWEVGGCWGVHMCVAVQERVQGRGAVLSLCGAQPLVFHQKSLPYSETNKEMCVCLVYNASGTHTYAHAHTHTRTHTHTHARTHAHTHLHIHAHTCTHTHTHTHTHARTHTLTHTHTGSAMRSTVRLSSPWSMCTATCIARSMACSVQSLLRCCAPRNSQGLARLWRCVVCGEGGGRVCVCADVM